MFKKLFAYILIALNFTWTFAATCTIGDAPPAPGDIVCIVGRIINVSFLVLGIVLIGMLAYGAIKIAMAFGDPKGLQGAKLHLQYVLIGFFVVAGLFALLSIIGKALNVGYLTPAGLLTQLEKGLTDLINLAANGNNN